MEGKYGGETYLPAFADFANSGVDLFFAISGFIMVYVSWTMRRGLKGFWEFLFGRLLRIYPIYWVVTTALLVVWLIAPDKVFSSYALPPDILKSYLLWPDTRAPLLVIGWTLIHELYFYIIFSFSLFFSRRWLLPFLGVWGGIVLIGNYFNPGNGGIAEFNLIFNPITFEFIFGALAGWAFFKWEGRLGVPIFAAAVIAAIGGLVWSIAADFNIWSIQTGLGAAPQWWPRVWLFGLPGALLCYGAAGLDIRGRRTHPFINTLGDASYSWYLTHIMVLSLVGMLWARVASAPGVIDNILALSLMVTASIAVALMTYYFIERPLIDGARWLRRRMFK